MSKRTKILALLVAAFAISTSSPHNSLTEGLIAYYSFNFCDARDESGNGSDGVLFGNVGYRILSANIEELLKHPGAEASWC